MSILARTCLMVLLAGLGALAGRAGHRDPRILNRSWTRRNGQMTLYSMRVCIC
jgi:hypothetical protein